MYSKNVQAVIKALLDKEGNIAIDTNDDVMSELVATYQGQVISGRLRAQMGLPEIKKAAEAEKADASSQKQAATK